MQSEQRDPVHSESGRCSLGFLIRSEQWDPVRILLALFFDPA